MKVDVGYVSFSAVGENRDEQNVRLRADGLGRLVTLDAAIRRPDVFRETLGALFDLLLGDAPTVRRSSATRGNDADGVADARSAYWAARSRLTRNAALDDRDHWRRLLPLDPLVTVADEVVTIEAMAGDESTYACLTLDRYDALESPGKAVFGTSFVASSWRFVQQLGTLRADRATRLDIDFLSTDSAALSRTLAPPPGWMHRFLLLHAAMALPMRRARLDRDCVAAMLSELARRPKQPDAVDVHLLDGQPPQLAVGPKRRRFASHGGRFEGVPTDPDDPIRLHGLQPLAKLARLLPLAPTVELCCLGSGQPSFWIARVPGMRLVVVCTGWTHADWDAGLSLETLTPPSRPEEQTLADAAATLRARGSIPRDALPAALDCDPVDAALIADTLARRGELLFDLADQEYRSRPILRQPIDFARLPRNAEAAAAAALAGAVRVRDTRSFRGGRFVAGLVDRHFCRAVIDDGIGRPVRNSTCDCHRRRARTSDAGPCRHVIALLDAAFGPPALASVDEWFERIAQPTTQPVG